MDFHHLVIMLFQQYKQKKCDKKKCFHPAHNLIQNRKKKPKLALAVCVPKNLAKKLEFEKLKKRFELLQN